MIALKPGRVAVDRVRPVRPGLDEMRSPWRVRWYQGERVPLVQAVHFRAHEGAMAFAFHVGRTGLVR